MSKNRNKKKRKKNIANIAIIISLIILAIPVAFVGVAGVQSLMTRGKPITGRRFANDLNPEIKTKQIDKLKKKIEALDGFENVEVELKSATLRVYALNESLTEGNMKTNQESVYGLVGEELSIEDYFTAHDGKKQYDLEIHLYNTEDVTDDNKSDYVYGIYVKNANMEKPYAQILTTPQSQEMVDYFIEEEEYQNQLEAEYENQSDVEEIEDVEIGEGDGD